MLRLCAALVALLVAWPVLAQTPDAATPRARAFYEFLMARRLDAAGDAAGALAALERAKNLDPASAEIHAELAGYYARQDKGEAAVAEAELALKIDPASEEAHHILGRVYSAWAEGVGRPPAGYTPANLRQRAIDHLAAIKGSSLMATDPNLQMTLGRLYLRSGAAAQAVPILERVAAEVSWVAEPQALLAEARMAVGQLNEAANALEAAAALNPRYWASLGDLYQRLGRWADAAAAYGKAVQRVRAPSRDLRLRWATALLDVPHDAGVAEARNVLAELLKTSPNDTAVLGLLSRAQRAAGDSKAAEATARQIIATDPAGAAGLHALALVLFDRFDYRQVVEVLTPFAKGEGARAQKRDRAGALVLAQLGVAHQQLGEYDAAIKAFTAARALAPDDLELDASVVQVLLAARRFDRAEALAREALARTPDQPTLVRLRAQALARSGRAAEATALLESRLAARPDSREYLVGLADLYTDLKRVDEAVGLLERARKMFEDDEMLTLRLASAYDAGGRIEEAEREVRRLLAQDPANANALNSLGYMLADRGLRVPEAVDLAQRALKIEPDNPAYLDTLGWALFKLGRPDEADAPLGRAAWALAGSSVIQEHHGDVLARRGKTAEAIAAWERALAGDGETIDREAIEKKVRDARARRR